MPWSIVFVWEYLHVFINPSRSAREGFVCSSPRWVSFTLVPSSARMPRAGSTRRRSSSAAGLLRRPLRAADFQVQTFVLSFWFWFFSKKWITQYLVFVISTSTEVLNFSPAFSNETDAQAFRDMLRYGSRIVVIRRRTVSRSRRPLPWRWLLHLYFYFITVVRIYYYSLLNNIFYCSETIVLIKNVFSQVVKWLGMCPNVVTFL